jgi:endo-1,4-beta-xylanase
MTTQRANLDLLASTGLPIYISELDIDGPTDEVQLADYQRIFPLFWEHPAIQGITLWGFRPGHWRTAQGAYLVLDNGAERPAMVWLQKYVKDSAPVVVPRQIFSIDAALAPSPVIGTVRATDADAGAALSGWAIAGGNDEAVFAIDSATGGVSVADPLGVDFRRKNYSLAVMVSDGLRASSAAQVAVKIPEVVRLCHRGRDIRVPRLLAHELLKRGDGLGRCGVRPH